MVGSAFAVEVVVELVSASFVLVDEDDDEDDGDAAECASLELELALESLLDDPSLEPASAEATAVPPIMAAPTPRVITPALNQIFALKARRASVPAHR